MFPLARGSWRSLLPPRIQCILGSKVSFLKDFPSILPCLRPKFSQSGWRPFYPATASQNLSPRFFQSLQGTGGMYLLTKCWKELVFGNLVLINLVHTKTEILRPDHSPDWMAKPPVSPLFPQLSSSISGLTSIPFHFLSVGYSIDPPCPQPRHSGLRVSSSLNPETSRPCLYSACLCDSPHLQLPRNPRVPPAQLLSASPPPAPPPSRLAEEGEPLSPPPPQLPTAAAAASAALPGPTSRPSALTWPNRGALQRHPYSFLGVRDA